MGTARIIESTTPHQSACVHQSNCFFTPSPAHNGMKILPNSQRHQYIPLQTHNTSTDIPAHLSDLYHLSYLNASQIDDNPIDSVINSIISRDGNQPSIGDQLSLCESISSVPYLSQGLLYLFSLEFRKITFNKTRQKDQRGCDIVYYPSLDTPIKTMIEKKMTEIRKPSPLPL